MTEQPAVVALIGVIIGLIAGWTLGALLTKGL